MCLFYFFIYIIRTGKKRIKSERTTNGIEQKTTTFIAKWNDVGEGTIEAFGSENPFQKDCCDFHF